jgi:prepilin-type N-terminal cleavage/methylation domain-containing protein
MNKNNAFRRGFTLIELMIVIVILGILMGTILPRLTGAQSRARDTARIADLNNISQALEVYSSDKGQYPNAACTGGNAVGCYNANCLAGGATGATDTYNVLKSYMKGDRVPQNVGLQTSTLGCIGSYYYSPLTKGGSPNQSYVLASDVETWQMANYETADVPTNTEFQATDEASLHTPHINKLSTEPTSATNKEVRSIYIVIP